MTFGYTVYWRGSFDESQPGDFVNFVHEVVHADQVRRYGVESRFACRYGEGYLNEGGRLPSYIRDPGMYELNPLEAEAYTFEAKFQDDDGHVVEERIPWQR